MWRRRARFTIGSLTILFELRKRRAVVSGTFASCCSREIWAGSARTLTRYLTDELVKKTRERLFGSWEMNWMAYNFAHDVALPGSSGRPIGFFMYPQAETTEGRLDPLAPEVFKYEITFERNHCGKYVIAFRFVTSKAQGVLKARADGRANVAELRWGRAGGPC
jgi:hypothetical protein